MLSLSSAPANRYLDYETDSAPHYTTDTGADAASHGICAPPLHLDTGCEHRADKGTDIDSRVAKPPHRSAPGALALGHASSLKYT